MPPASPTAPTARRLRILILRLSPFRDVVHSSSHLFLAEASRRALPDAAIDFAFLPERLSGPQSAAAGGSSGMALQDADLVLVSNSFVLEAINLPFLLNRCGLAPWAPDRPESAPPVILGGSNALASQCLVRPDGTAVPDAIFFGEGEGALEAFLTAWAPLAGQPKRARLEQAAAAADGFWVTGAWPGRPVRQAVCRDLPPPPLPLELPDGESADTVRLQASLGCPAFCAFCFEGYERKPYRERPAAWLLDHARQLKATRGARAVEVDAFNLNTHRELPELVVGLARLFDRVAFKSQRVDILAEQPELVDVEIAAGKRSYTLGIEGISQRLRAFLGKTLEEDAIGRVIRKLLAARVREIKLFFLATGHEQAADLAAFDNFCRNVANWAGGPRRTTRIVCSFGRLVRMPNTPLRHDRLFLDRAAWDPLLRDIENACTRSNLEYRLAASWPEYLATQLLAAADERAAPIVVRLAQEGFCFDGRAPDAYAKRLEGDLRQAGILDAAFAAPKPPDHHFPFAFVAKPVSPDFLHRQYEAALAGRDRGYCLGETCLACGACRNADEKAALTNRPRVPAVPRTTAETVAQLTAAKQRLEPVLARVRLDAASAGRSPEWISARLMQALLTRWPDEVDNLLAVEECLFDSPPNRERFPIPAGQTFAAIRAWEPTRLRKRLAAPFEADGLGFARATDEASAGVFGSATWQIRVAGGEAPAIAALTAWLGEAYLPHSLRRVAGVAQIDFAPAALRKRIVLAACCSPAEGGSTIELNFTPKADLRALLRLLPVQDQTVVTCTVLDGHPRRVPVAARKK